MSLALTFSTLIPETLWFNILKLSSIKSIVSYFDSGSDLSGKHSTQLNSKLVTKESAPKGICCAHCHTHITQTESAIEVQGKHQHIVTNPNGITFNISLYAQATCHAQTEAISDYSWFTGYEWRIVICPNCQQHLGWSYQQGHSPDFYGLITDKLIDFNK